MTIALRPLWQHSVRHCFTALPRCSSITSVPARAYNKGITGTARCAHYSTTNDKLSLRKTKLVSSRNHPKPTTEPKVLPNDQLVEEENLPAYDPKQWCSISPGDIFDDRYQTVAKIGWGTVSTVWLAKDLNKPTTDEHHGYYTLKVSKSNAYDREEALHELAVMKRLHDSNPQHKGFQYLRTYNDVFEVEDSSGSMHVCLVQEPMREPLGQFRRRFQGDKLPPKILEGFMQYFLSALDYVHSEAQVVHTDIKDDNILMTFESADVLSSFEASQSANPMPYKPLGQGRKIHQGHASFGTLQSFAVEPRLVDFGAAHRMDGGDYKLFPIQPRYYRAPEVILGTGWSYPADIWNLGVLAFTLLENHHLFRRVNTPDNTYDVKSHLAQMYQLLGPLPRHMVSRMKGTSRQHFEPAMVNDEGVKCDTPREYFGGPYFGVDGEFLLPELVPQDLTWENKVTVMEGENKEMFLRFIKRMIKWDPEERATAAELLDDPWLVQHRKVV